MTQLLYRGIFDGGKRVAWSGSEAGLDIETQLKPLAVVWVRVHTLTERSVEGALTDKWRLVED